MGQCSASPIDGRGVVAGSNRFCCSTTTGQRQDSDLMLTEVPDSVLKSSRIPDTRSSVRDDPNNANGQAQEKPFIHSGLIEIERIKEELEQQLAAEKGAAAARERELELLRADNRVAKVEVQLNPVVDAEAQEQERNKRLRKEKMQRAGGSWWISRHDFNARKAWRFKVFGELHQVAVSHAHSLWQVAVDNEIVLVFRHNTRCLSKEHCAGKFEVVTIDGQTVDSQLQVAWNFLTGKWDIRLKVNQKVVPPYWTRVNAYSKARLNSVDPPEVGVSDHAV